MKKKNLLLGLCALLFPLGGMAQYTIYPVPQQQEAGSGTARFTESVTVVCGEGIDSYTRDRAEQILKEHGLTAAFADAPSASSANLFLGINGSADATDAQATALGLDRSVLTKEGKYDRHILSLTADAEGRACVVILGEHTDAAFYGLASLEQILDTGTENLACVTLNDYADQKSRGIVEGYYGYPYSVSVKKDLMRFMMRHKMNTYLYGAKSDPYHSEKWKDAYPQSLTAEQEKNGWMSQDMISEVSEVSHQTKVNFIWAIHPGNDFVYSNTVVNDIMGKYEKMYSLGVRHFAVFVDDVGVPSSEADLKANADHLTALQHAIEEKWNVNPASPADTVRPLHFVPQIYCTSFASSTEQYNSFFRALSSTPSNITIYTTGGGVWSVPNSNDLAAPREPLGRSVAWWWNYPCNDNADSQVFPMDTYSNFYDMPAVWAQATLPSSLNNGLGVVSNPMQQGEVSKTPLFSVANYAWNNDGFDNMSSWEASFKAVLPGNEQAQAAYRFLAPYLRYNNLDDLSSLVSSYKKTKDAAALIARMEEIETQCNVLVSLKDSPVEGEALLYKDLSPWLLKLRAMASVTRSLLNVAATEGQDDSRWTSYLAELKHINELSTAEEFKAYALEGMGSGISTSVRIAQTSETVLLPFVSYLKDNALTGYFNQAEQPSKPGFISNVEGAKATVAYGNGQIYAVQTKAYTLQKGQWMGVQLVQPTRLLNLTVADTLLANHTVVVSADGKEWTRVTEAASVPEGYVRYFAIVNDNESPVSLRITKTLFRLQIPVATQVEEATIPEGNIWDNHTKELMYDGDPNTFVCLNRNQQTGDSYELKLTKSQTIGRVRIVMGTVNGDYMKEGRVQISEDGQKWTTLKVLGTKKTGYTLSLPQNVKLSDETTACMFDGEGRTAQYVRLYLSQANTSKWLRLYEIEVNGKGTFTQEKMADDAYMTYSEVYDDKASTSTAQAPATGTTSHLTYYFQNYSLLQGVTFYCDPATLETTEIELSLDGQEWYTKTYDAASGVVRLSFDEAEAGLKAMRFSWTGSQAPAIYELVENADADRQPVVTRIEQLETAAAGQTAEVSFRNGRLQVTAPQGIRSVVAYDTAGRQLLHLSLNGAAQTTLPLIGQAGQAWIIKVTLSDGSSVSYKVR